MAKRAILVCIDGCEPEYLRLGNAAFLKHVGKEGTYVDGDAMIPSVTNVNNVSILTGKYPDKHGVVSNYYLDRETGREVYMEHPDFIKAQTLLEQGTKLGLKTALLTSKEKLRTLLNRGATTSFSEEEPAPWVTKTIGDPPPIYSSDADLWLMKALREVMVREGPRLIYAVTTDYTMHKHPPGDPESRRHISGIDRLLQEEVERLEAMGEEVLLCVTADHGMSEKSRVVNLEITLRGEGVKSRVNTIIADRYVAHHSNMGGSVYIYLDDPRVMDNALRVLQDTEGVEEVLTRDEASRAYHLDRERIGDLLVLAEEEYVFGLVGEEVADVSLRSHGSLHERRVPIIVNQPELQNRLSENKDLFNLVLGWLV